MKVVQPSHIRACEESMFQALKQELDMEAVLEALKEGADMDSIETSRGELLLLDNKIVYQMDVSVTLRRRFIFDRQGNLLQMGTEEPPHPENTPQERILADIFLENQEFWKSLSRYP